MKIYQTEDYSSFKRIQGNRTINKAQVQKLYDSLGEHTEILSAIPIIVNDKMEIIDGQHRFEALKKLELPVQYIQVDGLGLSDVQILNSRTKIWSPVDYAKSFWEMGNQNYKVYLDFKSKYHLGHTTLISYLSANGGKTYYGTKSHNTVQGFRSGKFQVGDVAKAEKLCSQLVEFGQYWPKFETKSFTLAFKKICFQPEYDQKRMLSKVQLFGSMLKHTSYPEEYMRQLEKIYNHRAHERVKLF